MSDEATIGRRGATWLSERKIRGEIASRFGIYTARWEGKIVKPDADGNVVVFPFFEENQIVGEKWRTLPKGFSQRPGSKQIFWNAEVIAAAAGGRLIITEGEIDALTAIDCGFDNTVSVPNGAPEQAIDPATDQDGGKFAFLWEARRELSEVAEVVLAVDNDGNGTTLRAELVRRLSASRCLSVEYPPGCKDLNEVLTKHGPKKVVSVLNNARPYPVRGLYGIDDFPEQPELATSETGWKQLDQHLKPFPGELMVITGTTGHGKSSFAIHLICNMCSKNGWKAAIFSPEMPVKPQMHDKLRRILCQRSDAGSVQIAAADDWIRQHMVFLSSDPTGKWDDDELTVDWILEKATDAVHRHGIRILLIDPWNEVEHPKRKEELMTEYIGRSIRDLRRFAQQRDVIVIIVAHPTKEIVKEKRPPGLYDIDGSAHWANKPDHGVTVYIPQRDVDAAEIIVTKVRFGNTGRRGKVQLDYDLDSERYLEKGQ